MTSNNSHNLRTTLRSLAAVFALVFGLIAVNAVTPSAPQASAAVTDTGPDAGATSGPVAVTPVTAVTACRSRPCWPMMTIEGFINDDLVDKVVASLETWQDANPDGFLVVINSPGGSALAAFKLYHAFRNTPQTVQCIAQTTTASAAFILLQACDVRLAVPGTELMSHEVSMMFTAPTQLSRHELLEYAEGLRVSTDVEAGLIAARMKMPKAALLKRWGQGDWQMTPEEAYQAGAIDAILPMTATQYAVRLRSTK